MEALFVLGLVGVAAIVVWLVLDKSSTLVKVEETIEEIEEKIDEVVEEIKEDVKEALDSLPTANELKKLTKAKLEELGRDLGVELDKRQTKDNMIKELQEKVGK
jgi:2C-methyl-D-erythritol 2,4-cyclodiphosphate synthase